MGGLYLAARGGGEAVPLLPLIRMAPSLRNGTEACFFYTRATRDEVCFVCHHAAEVSEWRGPFEDTARLLGALRGIDKTRSR